MVLAVIVVVVVVIVWKYVYIKEGHYYPILKRFSKYDIIKFLGTERACVNKKRRREKRFFNVFVSCVQALK